MPPKKGLLAWPIIIIIIIIMYFILFYFKLFFPFFPACSSQFHGNLQIAIYNSKKGTLVILKSGEFKSPDFEKT
jgi:hypothetical protein